MIGPARPPNLSARSSSLIQDDEDVGMHGPASLGLHRPPPSSRSAPAASTIPPAHPAREEDDDDDDYAPALPPDLAAARSISTATSTKRVVGPAMPPAMAGPHYDDYDDDDDDIGPQPLPQGVVIKEKDGVHEFLEREERRRKQLEEESKPKALKRDEWMLVPPSSSDLLGSIDPTKLNRPRQFARTAQPSRNTDTSLWTETPAERQQRIADEVAGKRRRAVDVDPAEDPDARKRRKYEEEVRREVEEHTKNTRGGSLLQQHERVGSAKDKGDQDEPVAIWDHSRDMALGGKLLDDKTRDKFVREAKGLGDRFGSGKSGGFL